MGDAFGELIERVVLFASRVPAAVGIPTTTRRVSQGLWEIGAEMGPSAEIETDILLDTGAVINAPPFRAGGYDDRTGLMARATA